MAMNQADVVALELEKVRTKLPILYERQDSFFSMIENKDVEVVSNRNLRIPLQVFGGGDSGYFGADGSDMGRGTGTVYDVGTLTTIGAKIAVEITKLAEYGTDQSAKAIENATKREVANAMKQFRRDMNTWLQTGGSGVIGTVTAVNSNTLTLADAPFGARLIRANMTVGIFDSTLATYRGSSLVNSYTDQLGGTQTITLASAPAGTTATDVVVVGGLTTANPVWLYGIPYFHQNGTSGSYLGISRSQPYTQANVVNANGAALTLPPLRLAYNAVRQRVGDDGMAKLVPHMHPAQAAAYEELAQVISEIDKTVGAQGADLLFTGKMSIGGNQIKDDIHADITRIDFVNLDTWGRGETKPIDFYEVGGNTVFPTYGTSGGLSSSYLFYIVTLLQFFVDNPAAISSVTNLAVPAGY